MPQSGSVTIHPRALPLTWRKKVKSGWDANDDPVVIVILNRIAAHFTPLSYIWGMMPFQETDIK